MSYHEDLATKSVPEIALSVQDLQYRIGLHSILKNVAFEVNEGEVLALLGPNGAGKSTLLKCLAGLLPCKGKKLIFGELPEKNYSLRRKIGYLGHETFLYMKLSARENLLFYSSLYGIRPDVDGILKEYLLADFSEQYVETFSRGMKQRLALARALLSQPELLLLDEPFTGLDQQSCDFLLTKIHDLKGDVAFVVTTHELERAYEIADRFLILKNGRQVFYGRKEEIDLEIHQFYESKTA